MASFNDMPVTAKIGVVIAVALVLTAGLYFGVYKAIADQNETDAKSLAGKEAEIAQLKPYQNKLADLNRSVDALKQQLELQKRIVPDEQEVEGFIKMMQTEAQKSNVEIRRYTANPIVNKEFYSEAPFAMDIDGPYYSVLDFFQRVAKMERIININNLAMASVNKPTGAKVKKTYKYEPNETVVVSCVATAFFSRDNTAAPPPPKKAAN
jgi:type IV pilus assembly protein PilO